MKQFVCVAITGLALCAMVAAPGTARAEILVVGSNQIHFTQISKTKLRDLYTGQSQVVGDATVLVIDRHSGFDQKDSFIFNTLGFTTEEFSTIQRLLECIGINTAPTIARDGEHMFELLSSNPNALGYISREELPDSGSRSKFRFIKVLAE